jgi:hypothetical protein
MMAASDALVKSETPQQLTESFEGNVGIRGTPQDPKGESVRLAHRGYSRHPGSIPTAPNGHMKRGSTSLLGPVLGSVSSPVPIPTWRPRPRAAGRALIGGLSWTVVSLRDAPVLGYCCLGLSLSRDGRCPPVSWRPSSCPENLT